MKNEMPKFMKDVLGGFNKPNSDKQTPQKPRQSASIEELCRNMKHNAEIRRK